MSRLRVALVSSGLGHVTRGIEVWMTELAAHLPADIDAELWSGGAPPAVRGRSACHLHGISRDAAILRPWSWHRRYILEQLSVLPRTVLRLRKSRCDIVYCGDPVLSWHLKRFRSFHHAKVVFMNGMRLSAGWARDFDGVHLLAPPYLEQARRELGAENTNRFFAVPHFVDLEQFAPASAEQRAAARQQFGLPEKAFVVLTAGPVGQVSGKRLEWLAQEVAHVGPDCVLVSAGVEEDGAEDVRASVRAALGQRAIFVGRVERARMPQLYHAADVYSLGSLAEPFSIAILEALASGLPVVHHADDVMRWQTGDGGVPVSMSNAGEAAAAFRNLQSGEQQQRIGRSARKLAETRYAPKIVCAEWVQCVLRIAAPPQT
ncbi:MAG: glycosyltransferase family 4 protein [Verrucomicrobiota bacterium]